MSDHDRPFKEYAGSYDQIYQTKDYQSECSFVEAAAKRFGTIAIHDVLDLGCGTGGHAIPFAKSGYRVVGVDLSPEMLSFAREKAEREGCADKIELIAGDISEVRTGRQFDLIVCMFAVMSYLTRNDQLAKFFAGIKEQLRPGGTFVCDFWYGPAVLLDPPEAREKRIPIPNGEIVRKASPVIHLNENFVEVSYDLARIEGGKITEATTECHSMRYLFLPELDYMAQQSGLELVHACDFCDLDAEPNDTSWTASTVFRVA